MRRNWQMILPRWCNGSHVGLRSRCRKACEFESHPGHQNGSVAEPGLMHRSWKPTIRNGPWVRISHLPPSLIASKFVTLIFNRPMALCLTNFNLLQTKWLHSSVGRATDWKSVRQWFDSTWSHQNSIASKFVTLFIGKLWLNCLTNFKFLRINGVLV